MTEYKEATEKLTVAAIKFAIADKDSESKDNAQGESHELQAWARGYYEEWSKLNGKLT